MLNAKLEEILGCRIKTHYNTGGVVESYSGPYNDKRWTIVYRHDGDGSRCWINTIEVENGIILCEGKPLQILGREKSVQMHLF